MRLNMMICAIIAIAIMACGGNDKPVSNGEPAKVKVKGDKDEKKEEIQIDSTEIKRRQQELMKEDSIQRALADKEMKQKQECATKVVFLENFYNAYFNNPESAIRSSCTDRLISELRSRASEYEGGGLPVWVFSSGSGGSIQWKVNIPTDERSSTFTIDISAGGSHQKVYLTVVGSGGYYQIDRVKNPTEGY